MEFKRKFGRQKEKKSGKGVFLVLLLALAIFLWFKAESILDFIF
jgi:hypothetical protein